MMRLARRMHDARQPRPAEEVSLLWRARGGLGLDGHGPSGIDSDAVFHSRSKTRAAKVMHACMPRTERDVPIIMAHHVRSAGRRVRASYAPRQSTTD